MVEKQEKNRLVENLKKAAKIGALPSLTRSCLARNLQSTLANDRGSVWNAEITQEFHRNQFNFIGKIQE